MFEFCVMCQEILCPEDADDSGLAHAVCAEREIASVRDGTRSPFEGKTKPLTTGEKRWS